MEYANQQLWYSRCFSATTFQACFHSGYRHSTKRNWIHFVLRPNHDSRVHTRMWTSTSTRNLDIEYTRQVHFSKSRDCLSFQQVGNLSLTRPYSSIFSAAHKTKHTNCLFTWIKVCWSWGRSSYFQVTTDPTSCKQVITRPKKNN